MLDVILIALLFICVITDLKNRKIYNNVVFPGMLLALIIHAGSGGWEGLLHSFLGFLIGLGLLLLPYLMGGIGAGDVKLLAAVGAFKGGLFVFETFIYMAVLGGIIALALILCKYKTAVYPYGGAIAGGAVICLFTEGVLFA